VNSDCALKICDFGLARGVSLPAEKPESTKGPMTEYVATRWYRAPEIILSSSNYSKAIDVWSAGCIFAELLGGKVLFPGKDYVHQMSLIINIVGTPNDATLDKIGSEKAKEWVHNMPYKEKVALAKLFPDAEPLGKRPSLSLSDEKYFSLLSHFLLSLPGVDLLEKLLEFDPYKRITVEKALQHEYLALYHDPSDEPSHDAVDFSFEALDTIEDMRSILAKEIKTYRPPHRQPLQRQGSKNLAKAVIKKDDQRPIENLDEEMKAMDIDNDIETQLAKGLARPLGS